MKCLEGPGEPLKAIESESEIVSGLVRSQVLRQEDTEQAGKILLEVPTSSSQHGHFSFRGFWK